MEDTVSLVGDIGGTNVRLARARLRSDGRVDLDAVWQQPVADSVSLTAAIVTWQAMLGEPLPKHAAFALAGPTGADTVHLTNNAWSVSASDLRARFGFRTAVLVNDFAALARAVPAAPLDRFETLIAGQGDPAAPLVVLGPGTGLGLAILLPHARGWQVLSTEAGHQAFAPRDETERRLLANLSTSRDYVCFEDFVSGRGLERIYRALAPPQATVSLIGFDAAAIGRAALAQSDPRAVEAARLLTRMLATFAGNAVFATGARGGCIIAGGVADALAPFLREPAFAERVRDRGTMRAYVEDVPVRLLRDPHAALAGAALMAAGA